VPEVQKLWVGQKVLVTANLRPVDGVVNGLQTTIRDFVRDREGNVLGVQIMLPDNTWFVAGMTMLNQIGMPGIGRCYEVGLPIAPAPLQTFNKFQGVTLSGEHKFFIEVNEGMPSVGLYVAVSRPKRPEQVYFFGKTRQELAAGLSVHTDADVAKQYEQLVQRAAELPPPDIWLVYNEFTPLLGVLRPFDLTLNPVLALAFPAELLDACIAEAQQCSTAEELMALSWHEFFIPARAAPYEDVRTVHEAMGLFATHFDAIREASAHLGAAEPPAHEAAAEPAPVEIAGVDAIDERDEELELVGDPALEDRVPREGATAVDDTQPPEEGDAAAAEELTDEPGQNTRGPATPSQSDSDLDFLSDV
jgi:hypothetical protein